LLPQRYKSEAILEKNAKSWKRVKDVLKNPVFMGFKDQKRHQQREYLPPEALHSGA
jgi:hypothetical protein